MTNLYSPNHDCSFATMLHRQTNDADCFCDHNETLTLWLLTFMKLISMFGIFIVVIIDLLSFSLKANSMKFTSLLTLTKWLNLFLVLRCLYISYFLQFVFNLFIITSLSINYVISLQASRFTLKMLQRMIRKWVVRKNSNDSRPICNITNGAGPSSPLSTRSNCFKFVVNYATIFVIFRKEKVWMHLVNLNLEQH